MKFFDLFGGIGGFRLGLERNGGECVGYCDFDKYAVKCYNENFLEAHEPIDARKLDDSNLPDFALLCAGFPCQPFSLAGKRKGFNEERGTLFHEIVRLVEIRRPAHLLLENVKGLLSAQDGYCFAFIVSRLEELGYCVEWEVLNSKNFGVPQNRERVFIHGFREGSGQEIFPLGQGNSVLERENASKQASGEGVCSTIHGGYANLQGQGETYLIDPNTIGEPRVYGENAPCLNTPGGGNRQPLIVQRHFFERSQEWGDGIYENETPTLDSSAGRDLLVGGVRRLTPVECERLQGFPDNWTACLSDSRRYKALGNAVTVNVVQAIGEKLSEVK